MAGEMNWVSKKIHLYNVTMGLYMLDWWERCLFSILPPRLDRIPVFFLLLPPLQIPTLLRSTPSWLMLDPRLILGIFVPTGLRFG
jgi:hypothetical protein